MVALYIRAPNGSHGHAAILRKHRYVRLVYMASSLNIDFGLSTRDYFFGKHLMPNEFLKMFSDSCSIFPTNLLI